jgi:serine/threonine-protein kinase
VPIGFDGWWNRAVARDPEKRFQTAKELTEALREALGIESRDALREAPSAAPDIEVTSAPDTARDTPPTDPVPGMHASGVVTSGPFAVKADDVVEPNAATVVAPVPAELPALTERQFSTTQKSPPSAPAPSSDGTGIVIGVAAAFLFIGLIAGVLFLRSQREDAQDQHRALPQPLPVAVHEPSEPRVAPKPKAVPSASASAEKPLLEFLPGDASSAAPPVAAVPPGAPEPRAAAAAKPETAAPAAGATPSPAPGSSGVGGAWVKPAWAIPDGEPVRRAPISE